jgi:lipid II:glycine glycyltransferase (peptidoglycan interpeptide bridge formation enzyme)
MNSTAFLKEYELNALSKACATFDPSKRDQRMIIRIMVVPMLTRKLDDLRIALRANEHSESIQKMIDEITHALNRACVRLDCTFDPRIDAAISADEARMEKILASLPARAKIEVRRTAK